MKFMDGLVWNNNTFHDIPTRHEGSLCWAHHRPCYFIQPVSPNFSKNLETNVEDTNRSILLNLSGILNFWN
jgi:hypothetical protein